MSFLTEASDSWVEAHRAPGLSFSIQNAWWNFKVWLRETTDLVILNSPWLRRETGRALRAMWVILHGSWWCFHRKKALAYPLMTFLWLLLVTLGMLRLVYSSSESLLGTTALCLGLQISSSMQSAWFREYLEVHAQAIVMVVFCHCNVHPASFFIVFMIDTYINVVFFMQELRHPRLRDWITIPQAVYLQVSELALLAAYITDFTARVKAVTSGVLFDTGSNHASEEALKSPVAGRSGRKWCWLMGLANWLIWFYALVARAELCKNFVMRGAKVLFRNQLPIANTLAPLLMLLFCTASLHPRCPLRVADAIFGLFCCLPSLLILTENMIIPGLAESAVAATAYTHLRPFAGLGMLGSVLGIQALIQGGCIPFICGIFALSSSSLMVAVWIATAESKAFWPSKWGIDFLHLDNPLVSGTILWILVASHSIDFFKRIKAIREGMARSWDNAASQEMLLRQEAAVEEVEMPVIQGIEDEVEEGVSNPERLSVCVVRHAERADASVAFDDWCTSEDAAAFPFDPPITERGFQQAKKLAGDLRRKHVSFKVVISSPFLRCLQTAMTLAEQFDADVLVDHELGEVMGPEAFESEPPWPPRPWPRVVSTLKLNFDTKRLKGGRFMGQRPEWSETLQRARLRYANRFVDYLRRARHTKKSCLLVTHGHMVQVCATILPATARQKVISVDYAAMVLAICHRSPNSFHETDVQIEQQQRTISFHMRPATNPEKLDHQSQLQERNELLQEARLKYWEVWLQGVRTVSSSGPRMPAIIRQLYQYHESLGRSWQDVVRLLGVLPPTEEFDSVDNEQLSESACSFHTDTMTVSSMAMFRDPTIIPSSPGQPGRSAASSAPEAKTDAHIAVPQMTARALKQVELSLGSNALARRRREDRTDQMEKDEKEDVFEQVFLTQ